MEKPVASLAVFLRTWSLVPYPSVVGKERVQRRGPKTSAWEIREPANADVLRAERSDNWKYGRVSRLGKIIGPNHYSYIIKVEGNAESNS